MSDTTFNDELYKKRKAHALYMRGYYRRNADKVRSMSKKYYANNRNGRLEYSKRYSLRNREKILEYHKLYYRTNKPRFIKYQHDWIAKNKERKRINSREWLRNHPESKRAWIAKNKEKVKAYKRKWRNNNKHKINAQTHKRRALKAGAVLGDQSIVNGFIKSIRSMKTVECYYCKNKTPGKSAHIDHVVALSRGGNHSVSNIVASCPECNVRKGANMISEWKRTGQQIFSL